MCRPAVHLLRAHKNGCIIGRVVRRDRATFTLQQGAECQYFPFLKFTVS